MHRVAWLIVHGAWPVGLIDHINGEKVDNRLANLREADKAINAQNRRGPAATSTVGFLGVSRQKNGRFQARIGVGGKNVALGTFDTAEEAHAAHIAGKRRLHRGCML